MAVTVTCRNSRTFDGRPEAIGQARAWTLACLPDSCPRAYEVALVVSELATNTILHSASGAPGGSFDLVVEVGLESVEVTVIDQGRPLVPLRREPGESGWGLAAIVQCLADAYEATDTETGRTVWCRLDWPHTGSLTSKNV
jgi:anti-sigma regulatory factor (Ser/Thr protein kinase)